MRFSVNTLCMFPGQSIRQALDEMLPLGYDAFELWTLQAEQIEEIERCIQDKKVCMSAFCPSFFILNDKDRHDEYEASLLQAIATAKRLSCKQLITQVGQDNGKPRQEQHNAIVQGLRRVAPHLEKAGITLLVEPLNDVKDHKGYFLTDSNEGFAIIREVDSPKVRLLFDVYHQVHMGEDVLSRIQENLPLIGHFHVAGHPNRDEKLFHNFDYDAVFRLIRESGTDTMVGLELFCKADTSLELLKDLKKYME